MTVTVTAVKMDIIKRQQEDGALIRRICILLSVWQNQALDVFSSIRHRD